METRAKTVTTKEPQPQSFFNFKRIGLVLLVLIIAIGVPMLVQQLVFKNIISNTETRADSRPFEILSVPPENATTGSEYKYLLRVGRYDSLNVYAEAVTKPSWLKWDNEKFVLSGTPNEKYLGQNYVVIRVTDTLETKEQAFTIYVEALENPDVKGITTDQNSYLVDQEGSQDEEELIASRLCQQYYDELGPLGVISSHPECKGVFAVNNSGQVKGTSDFIDSVFNGDVVSLEASGVGSAPVIFGIQINDTIRQGLIASLAVVFVGLAILFGWMVFTAFTSCAIQPGENKKLKKTFKLSRSDTDNQESFIEDKSDGETNIIIWD